MLESLHVLDLYFPPELSILKLPFFMKHPVQGGADKLGQNPFSCCEFVYGRIWLKF